MYHQVENHELYLRNNFEPKIENEQKKINVIKNNQSQLKNNELNQNNNASNMISLGINIGAFKTVYSMFLKSNEKFITHVLLMNKFIKNYTINNMLYKIS